jgi:hypothetical protein
VRATGPLSLSLALLLISGVLSGVAATGTVAIRVRPSDADVTMRRISGAADELS